MLKKKIWANFHRIIELFTGNLSLSSQQFGFVIRDLGSGKNLFRIPDPGVKEAPDPGSGSATLPRTCVNSFCFLGKEIVDIVLDRIRKMADMCSGLQVWYTNMPAIFFFLRVFRFLGTVGTYDYTLEVH
jgi:hypothetical protein